jgi:hypothetical protein
LHVKHRTTIQRSPTRAPIEATLEFQLIRHEIDRSALFGSEKASHSVALFGAEKASYIKDLLETRSSRGCAAFDPLTAL